MPRDQNEGVDVQAFAANTRKLLSEDPRRYRQFGAYWFFVKAILKRVYDRHEMPMLGDYVDQSVVERMPKGMNAHDLLASAIAEYAANAGFNMGQAMVEDDDGESFLLQDTDIEG